MENVVIHFNQIENYFVPFLASGVLTQQERLVGQHARYQIFKNVSRQELDTILRYAPNVGHVTQDVYELGPTETALTRLQAQIDS